MGREFLHIFDQWASSYDTAVHGEDEQYQAVFEYYDEILEEVALRAFGKILEFGSGTGNLTEKLLQKQLDVTAIEPNREMRRIAEERFPKALIQDGDFLNFEFQRADTIVSSYAFHHLSADEKHEALLLYHSLLSENGKIIFADTMFLDETTHQTMIEQAKSKGYTDLAEDLGREYYTTIPHMKETLEDTGYQATFKQLNDYVWLMEAWKKNESHKQSQGGL